jgi:glutathione peroxidase-family protein
VTANRFRVSFFFLKISGINGNNHSPLWIYLKSYIVCFKMVIFMECEYFNLIRTWNLTKMNFLW